MRVRGVDARRLAAAAALTVAGVASLGVAHSVRAAATSCSVGVHRVGLVVEHSDGRIVDVCVGFNAATLTGDEILQDSGVQYAATYQGGVFVCQIDGEPAGYQAGSSCYSTPDWAYFLSRQGAAWSYSQSGVGSTSQTFSDGDSIGFRYESNQDPPSGPYPLPAANPPTPVPTPRATPRPAHTGTPTAPGLVAGATPVTASAAAAPPPSTPASSPTPPASVPAAPAARATLPAAAVHPASAPPPSWPSVLALALAALLVARLVVVGVRRRRRAEDPTV